MPPIADLGDFFDAVDKFFSSLAKIQWGALILALLLFGVYLTFRARASFNVMRAAYPVERFRFRDVWGAYMAGYGFNSVIPARGGDVVRLFLTKSSIPRSSYPAVGAALLVDLLVDLVAGVGCLLLAVSPGRVPYPPR